MWQRNGAKFTCGMPRFSGVGKLVWYLPRSAVIASTYMQKQAPIISWVACFSLLEMNEIRLLLQTSLTLHQPIIQFLVHRYRLIGHIALIRYQATKKYKQSYKKGVHFANTHQFVLRFLLGKLCVIWGQFLGSLSRAHDDKEAEYDQSRQYFWARHGPRSSQLPGSQDTELWRVG